jgi:hypothetical protein
VISDGLQLGQLGLQPLTQPVLNQFAEIVHQGVIGPVDQAHPIALATDQSSPLQLTQLAADVGLAESGGFDQGRHIAGPLFQFAEELQPSRFTEQAEELTEFFQQLGAGDEGGHNHRYDSKSIMD